ncbi:ferritin light chain, oocyte isoform [Scleropages formosus]|uniref:Ferritin n=1 Tax=Scleropages formosus TaxID=113540 RepID=A0A8C9QZV0_SCLFO|nr:ferritin light chain, oocyte isoform-like [Scleropages formosus]
MSEPSSKRPRSSVPVCRSHGAPLGSAVRQNLPVEVEEGLCGVTGALLELTYCLQALATIFEQDDVGLPRVAAFFRRESEEQQEQAEAMLAYLSDRGGHYCNKDVQKPGCEGICAIVPALEMMLGRWKELLAIMTELSQLAKEHGDPHTASVVKGCFLTRLVAKVKALGDILSSARRVGCTSEGSGGCGEYLIEQLQAELSGI